MAIVGGATLLAIAAGTPVWQSSSPGSIIVMVDLSPSTRGATFRDRSSLDRRVRQLLGDLPFELIAFADHNQPLGNNPALVDIPADKTIFTPPAADAVLLLSDGRFDLPAFAPPTYPVIDPALDHPADAVVTRLSPIGDGVAASIRNNSSTRPIHWTGAAPDDPRTPAGDFTQIAKSTGSGPITAALPPGDLWPENDSLTLQPPPPTEAARWWVGPDPPPGWRNLPTLPADPSEYLAPGVIVLNNQPADAVSSDRQIRLMQFVRDLGGNLIIVGGEHAFAAGGYEGSILEELSPLSSSPPQPSMRWLLLIDGSGSMSGDPWKTEIAALTGMLPQLPANDSVSVGSFARSINWWTQGVAASTVSKMHFPPGDAGATGPTNLADALQKIVDNSDGSSPTQLMLMTDADAELPHATELATAMKAKGIHLYLLALGHGSALPALRSMADATIEQPDDRQWITAANQLLRSALPSRYRHEPSALIPGPGSVTDWNQTWAKPQAVIEQKTAMAPMIAHWRLGLGQVTAIAFPARSGEIAWTANKITTPPIDPRFEITWYAGPQLRVKVNAVDQHQYLNGRSLSIALRNPQDESSNAAIMPIPQTGPGLYEINIPASRTTMFVTVTDSGTVLRRFAVAGRYPPEFEAIGNDRANLQSLADRTGGAVIPPGAARKIDFNWPPRSTDLSSEFAIAGFVVIAIAMAARRLFCNSI